MLLLSMLSQPSVPFEGVHIICRGIFWINNPVLEIKFNFAGLEAIVKCGVLASAIWLLMKPKGFVTGSLLLFYGVYITAVCWPPFNLFFLPVIGAGHELLVKSKTVTELFDEYMKDRKDYHSNNEDD